MSRWRRRFEVDTDDDETEEDRDDSIPWLCGCRCLGQSRRIDMDDKDDGRASAVERRNKDGRDGDVPSILFDEDDGDCRCYMLSLT